MRVAVTSALSIVRDASPQSTSVIGVVNTENSRRSRLQRNRKYTTITSPLGVERVNHSGDVDAGGGRVNMSRPELFLFIFVVTNAIASGKLLCLNLL